MTFYIKEKTMARDKKLVESITSMEDDFAVAVTL